MRGQVEIFTESLAEFINQNFRRLNVRYSERTIRVRLLDGTELLIEVSVHE